MRVVAWEPHLTRLSFPRQHRVWGKFEATGWRMHSQYHSMNPVTRAQLTAFYAAHNQRLYDYLGEDFGWVK